MITDDIERLIGKKVKEIAVEEAGMYYLMLTTTHGLKFVLSSESPIYVDVETEQ